MRIAFSIRIVAKALADALNARIGTGTKIALGWTCTKLGQLVPSEIRGRVSVARVSMTLKANRVTWLRRTVLPQGSLSPDGPRARAPPTATSRARRPRAASSGVQRARDDPRSIVPARRLLLRRRVGGC